MTTSEGEDAVRLREPDLTEPGEPLLARTCTSVGSTADRGVGL